MKKKLLAALLCVAMTATMLAGCGKKADSTNTATNAGTGTEETSGDPVTLKMFSNLPDRKNGQGLVEQTIIDEYMAANPNVTIEVEALDEESYKTKFKAYAMDGMPDIVSIWGQPSFLDEVLDAGVLAELNESDYADYEFVSGSLDGFKKDGKLYGLPRNTDIMVFYYNQKMFTDNGWEVPTTYEEYITLAGKINEANIIPVAMDGGDGWVLACYLQDLMVRLEGYPSEKVAAAIANGDGYAVAESSANKAEAIKFLNYMYQPDKLSEYGWENGVGLSAQNQTPYLSGNETELQLQIMDLLNNATSISGTPINDCGSSNFKTVIETDIQSMTNGSMSVDSFLSNLGAACE